MKVKLLTKTENMELNIYRIWKLSRSQVPEAALWGEVDLLEAKEFFKRIINEAIPLAEMIDFIFLLEDIPIALREQLVRHRIGVKVAGQEFCDLVPDLADSSFWSQSMRVLDMSNFEYFTPESIKEGSARFKGEAAMDIYARHMFKTRVAYSQLLTAGIPREDARNVIPLGATHRIIWKLNLASIKHIMSKRGCWILQLGFWKPIIQGIIEELCKLDPSFRQLISPPCIQGNKFKACSFCVNNYSRIQGDIDPLPPCPLFLNYYRDQALDCSRKVFPESTTCWFWQSDADEWTCCAKNQMPQMKQMRIDYAELWQRNVDTGKSHAEI